MKLAAIIGAMCLAGSAFALEITENTVLDSDTDWRAQGAVTVAAGVTLDLNGHKLTVKGLTCAGSIVDNGAAPQYRALDWVDVNGHQFIDTGFKPSASSAVRIDFEERGTSSGSKDVFICSDKVRGYALMTSKDAKCYIFYGTGNFVSGNKLCAYENYRRVVAETVPEATKQFRLWDGNTGEMIATVPVELTNVDNTNLKFFAGNSSGQKALSARIYSFSVKDNGTALYDCVPALRTSDNVAGFYNRVNDSFIASGGTQAFIAGDVSADPARGLHLDLSDGAAYSVAGTVSVPVAVDDSTLSADCDLRCFGSRLVVAGNVDLGSSKLYVQHLAGTGKIYNDSVCIDNCDLLDYVQTDGGAWVNTGFIPSQDVTEFNAAFTLHADQNELSIFGANHDADNFWMDINRGANGCYWYCPKNLNGNAFRFKKTLDYVLNQKQQVMYHAELGRVNGYDGTTLALKNSNELKTGNATLPMTIFADTTNGGHSSKARMHHFRMANYRQLRRDFVPARRRSDSVVGFFDCATGRFYPSNSNTAFTGGPVVAPGVDAATAELHIDVANGVTERNNLVRIDGAVKLVKDGAGTFIAARNGQGYTGGNTVTAGTLKPWANLHGLFGHCGTLTIAEGAQYLDDVWAPFAVSSFDLVVAGSGTDGKGAVHMTLSGNNSACNSEAQFCNHSFYNWARSLTLTGDAVIGRDDGNFSFHSPYAAEFPLALNGHELHYTSNKAAAQQSSPYAFMVGVKANGPGTFVVDNGLSFISYQQANNLAETTLVIESGSAFIQDGTAVNNATLAVSNLVYRSASASSRTTTTTVYGTYTPASTTSAPKVQLGDANHLATTLDLNAQGAAFDANLGGGLTFFAGSTVTVDLSERTPAVGDCLVEWTAVPANVVFKLDDTTAARGESLQAIPSGLYYGMSPEEPVIAWWTGEAGDGSVSNPANWACTNALNEALEGKLPGIYTVVHFAGDVACSILPDQLSYSTLTFDHARLSANCDWSGLGSAPFSGTIDLHGHQLTIAPNALNGTTYTDSTTDAGHPGELHVVVAANFNNTASLLSGNLKLVKEGAATLTVSRALSYTGGTLVSAGTLKAGANYPFGPTSGAGAITVAAGAVLEHAGIGMYWCYPVVLAGGTLQNTGAHLGAGVAQLSNMRLTADSQLKPTSDCGFINSGYAPSTLDLGGYKLTVPVGGGRYFWADNLTITAGFIDLTSGGWLVVDRGGVNAPNTDIRVNCAFDLKAPLSVHDYEPVFDAPHGHGTVKMSVYGTFKPTVGMFYGCEMQNGSAIDLSMKNAEWSTTRTVTGQYADCTPTISFAANAEVMVTPGAWATETAAKKRIIFWEAAKKPDASVKFKLPPDLAGNRWLVKFEEDGVYILRNPGVIVNIR